MDPEKRIIGRRDRIDLPELGYADIRAKVDTGAYGSVIHCSHIEVIRMDDREVLTFTILDPRYSGFQDKKCYFEEYTDKLVKSSTGQTEHRYSIRTEAIIFDRRIGTEFSLTDRSQMKYPILLGRKFLQHGFLVDVRRKNLSYKRKINKGK